MDNYDANMIKPVDGLQNITGLAPARRREERRSKRQFSSENEEQQDKQHDEENKKKHVDDSLNIDNAGDSKIDYRA